MITQLTAIQISSQSRLYSSFTHFFFKKWQNYHKILLVLPSWHVSEPCLPKHHLRWRHSYVTRGLLESVSSGQAAWSFFLLFPLFSQSSSSTKVDYCFLMLVNELIASVILSMPIIPMWYAAITRLVWKSWKGFPESSSLIIGNPFTKTFWESTRVYLKNSGWDSAEVFCVCLCTCGKWCCFFFHWQTFAAPLLLIA